METLMKYKAKPLFSRSKEKDRAAEKKGKGGNVLSWAPVQILLLALGLNLLIELLNHKGLGGLLSFIGEHPLAFFANYLIILVTLVPALFFKRRIFYMGMVGIVWAIGGIANGIIILNRMTPFTTADLAVFATGFEILPTYFTKFEMVLLVLAAVVVITAAVLLFLKGPKSKDPLPRRLLVGVAATVLTSCALGLTIKQGLEGGGLSTIFSNLAYAYEDYGFGYCFANTWLNVGIRTPENYSAEDMGRIMGEMDDNAAALPQGEAMTDVNVVYVQLESFF